MQRDKILILHFPGRVPAMKSKNRFDFRSNKLRKDTTVTDYVALHCNYLRRQYVESSIRQIEFPIAVAIRLTIFGKCAKDTGLPTFDIDGITTTIMEMLQPRDVSPMGVVGCIGNDRQIRSKLVRPAPVAHRSQEHTMVAIWPEEEEEGLTQFVRAGKLLQEFSVVSKSKEEGLQELLNFFDL